ncbi:plastocyanin/azurin family copper-binding protein [Nitrosopumilus sp.]|nr:plastocyanin/azurin family copper-binding protein [Nitrosopumilus sp.]
MASIDKIAIVVTLAIVLVAIGVVAMASSSDNAPTTPTQQMNTDAADARAEAAQAEAAAEARAEAAAEARAEAAADAAAEARAKADAKAAAIQAKAEVADNAGPQTHIVEPAQGSGSPGCETSNACYLPADITINVGDTVEWINSDIAPHTMTSGILKEGGPDGVFDSGLKMKDTTFEFTFNDAGTYGYFCQVHPWMTGTVTVN